MHTNPTPSPNQTPPTCPVTVASAQSAMQSACDAYNAAHRAGADAETLAPLYATHSEARAAWFRARAAAGDGQASIMVAIGAA